MYDIICVLYYAVERISFCHVLVFWLYFVYYYHKLYGWCSSRRVIIVCVVVNNNMYRIVFLNSLSCADSWCGGRFLTLPPSRAALTATIGGWGWFVCGIPVKKKKNWSNGSAPQLNRLLWHRSCKERFWFLKQFDAAASQQLQLASTCYWWHAARRHE